MDNIALLEILFSDLPSIILASLKWILVGVFIGGLASIIVFFLLNAIGALKFPPKYSKLTKSVVFVYILILFTLSFGFVGFHEGTLASTKKLLTEGEIAENAMPELGYFGADVLVMVDLFAKDELKKLELKKTSQAIPQETQKERSARYNDKLESFRDGEIKLDLEQMLNELTALKRIFSDEINKDIRLELTKKYPSLSKGVGKSLMDWFLVKLIRGHIDKGIKEKIPLLDQLNYFMDELAKSVDSDGTSYTRPELSKFFVSEVIDVCMSSVKSIVRTQQIIALVATFFLFLIPFIILFFLNRISAKESENHDNKVPGK
jgi:hypothetical protein